jgi:hypothetical protein
LLSNADTGKYYDVFMNVILSRTQGEELAKPVALPFQLSGTGYWFSGQAARNQ